MGEIRAEGDRPSCPTCAGPLSQEAWAAGLCLTCLAALAQPDEAGAAETDALLTGEPAFAAGRILGHRYRLHSLLGDGGLGEVWRAHDLKLRVDVALKALRADRPARPRALETLRQEVRAARQVVSPNVCRVFDLVEIDGRELVSMEYVDGGTLAQVLASRSPLKLDEAREIAAQLLAGLDAIHGAGLVHRDIKPENVMLTRAGRLVVMDFGLAKALAADRLESVAGTTAYMAPEQARGEALDARTDVFAAGILLAELTAPSGIRDHGAREAVWSGIRRSPPELAETPWAPVLRKALASVKEDRFPSAAALARALEEVTLRVAGAESLEPYPGLAAFAAKDADYFFGRELEIESMWRKLRHAHLLAVVGPSGAGKSSFLRAGLMATAPVGWRVLVATPGDRPLKSLAQALIRGLSGDSEALELLLRIEEPEAAVEAFACWRRRHDHALLVLDQFEELFTQSTQEVQAAFAALLGRLALDADVHVLLSMRDDFLFRCHAHEALQPILSELTLLGPLTGASLRRALVQPALKCGYRFEDDALVDSMLAEVESERGALPLVAFAAAQLWERRDRERGMLTREAYSAIGGVGGALAQHAEATLERIGHERVAIVRELLRNLVTAQGTRATVDREELLSVFASAQAGFGRDAAAAVLEVLVDARLLTSYELPKAEGESSGHQRIEIIHESLLSQWPRLVRWLAQDQDGALLRDQLRQAARMWEERRRPEDLLWTGTSFREYELWRERYAGPLSAAEEDFAQAMTDRTRRRQRQRRWAVAAVVGIALAVASGMGVLWRKSEAARAQAVEAARQAEAQRLFALGQLEVERNPTAAVAYSLASLEQDDTPHARLLALRALWRGPTAWAVAPTDQGGAGDGVLFSPDGRWLASVDERQKRVQLWERDGSGPRELPFPGKWQWLNFTADSRFVVITQPNEVLVYSLPGAQLVRRTDEGGVGFLAVGVVGGQELVSVYRLPNLPDGRLQRLLKIRRLPDGEPETLGVWRGRPSYGAPASMAVIDVVRQRILWADPAGIYELPLRGLATAKPRLVLRTDDPLKGLQLAPDGERIYTWGVSGAGRILARATGERVPGPRIDKPADATWWKPTLSLDGRSLAVAAGEAGALVSDLSGPIDAEPRSLRRDARVLRDAIDATGSWLATSDERALALWPLKGRHPHVLRAPDRVLSSVAIDPHGGWLVASAEYVSGPGRAYLWPLRPEAGVERLTLDTGAPAMDIAASPRGDLLAVGTESGAWLMHPKGGPPERLPGFAGATRGLVFDSTGRRLAAGGYGYPNPAERVVRVWDLATGHAQVLDPGEAKPVRAVAFLPDGRVLSSGGALRSWDLATGRATVVQEGVAVARVSPDGRRVLGVSGEHGPQGTVGPAFVYDLEAKTLRSLETHGKLVTCVAWDTTGKLVLTGSRDGIVRVGPVTGEEPHLLIGHETAVRDIQMRPDGQWIASAGEDGTVRLWPLPSEGPPFQTLPHRELVDLLRAQTNFRAIPDPSAPGGYRVDFERFTGWSRQPPSW